MKFRYNTIMQFFSTKKTTIEKTNLFIPIPVKGNKYNKYDKCKNEKNIGRCNHNIDKDFSSKLYQDDIAKCKWSKYCNAPWEGVDNLCADLTVNQLDPFN